MYIILYTILPHQNVSYFKSLMTPPHTHKLNVHSLKCIYTCCTCMQYYRSALVHCHLSFQASWLDQVFFLEVGGGPSDNFVLCLLERGGAIVYLCSF